jgi:hypothetical protein
MPLPQCTLAQCRRRLKTPVPVPAAGRPAGLYRGPMRRMHLSGGPRRRGQRRAGCRRRRRRRRACCCCCCCCSCCCCGGAGGPLARPASPAIFHPSPGPRPLLFLCTSRLPRSPHWHFLAPSPVPFLLPPQEIARIIGAGRPDIIYIYIYIYIHIYYIYIYEAMRGGSGGGVCGSEERSRR